MDTFTPPFEPQTPAPPSQLPVQQVPAVAPTPVEISTPITPATSNATLSAPKNAWQMMFILGLILLVAGIAGYLYLWLM